MKYITGIASTTHIDRQNECMAKSALDDMAIQIREKFIPQLEEHNPDIRYPVSGIRDVVA